MVSGSSTTVYSSLIITSETSFDTCSTGSFKSKSPAKAPGGTVNMKLSDSSAQLSEPVVSNATDSGSEMGVGSRFYVHPERKTKKKAKIRLKYFIIARFV